MKLPVIKLFLAFTLLVTLACSKEPLPDVSGSYYIRDSTFNVYSHYPYPYEYKKYDSMYTITVTYADREKNIVQIGTETYKLDENGSYNFYGSSRGGYSKKFLSLSNNQLYYFHESFAGIMTFYTRQTGKKIN